MDSIQIVLVDDNIHYRRSLLALLSQWSHLNVIAEADNGDLALDLAAQLRPDLLIVDVVMPGMSGIDLTQRLKALSPPPAVLVLTMHSLSSYRTSALAAGADDFLAKDQVTTALGPAIRRLFPGAYYDRQGGLPAEERAG